MDLNHADSISLDNIPGNGSMVQVLKAYRRIWFHRGYVTSAENHLLWKSMERGMGYLLRIDSIPAPKLSLVSSIFQELLAFPDLNYEQVKRLCFTGRALVFLLGLKWLHGMSFLKRIQHFYSFIFQTKKRT